jgi:hypothetical protein
VRRAHDSFQRFDTTKRGRSELEFEDPCNLQFIARAMLDCRGSPRLVIGEKACLTLQVAESLIPPHLTAHGPLMGKEKGYSKIEIGAANVVCVICIHAVLRHICTPNLQSTTIRLLRRQSNEKATHVFSDESFSK